MLENIPAKLDLHHLDASLLKGYETFGSDSMGGLLFHFSLNDIPNSPNIFSTEFALEDPFLQA